jgi:hypothetical protein
MYNIPLHTRVTQSPCMTSLVLSPCMTSLVLSPCMTSLVLSPCMTSLVLCPCMTSLVLCHRAHEYRSRATTRAFGQNLSAGIFRKSFHATRIIISKHLTHTCASLQNLRIKFLWRANPRHREYADASAI